ncbi:MAG TPA: hypothetical protein VG317_17905, partial [Pseudonocardiaceae bacterium]|nr:hypothetical protein [Pseudonocardiaceae bacterium]
ATAAVINSHRYRSRSRLVRFAISEPLDRMSVGKPQFREDILVADSTRRVPPIECLSRVGERVNR